MTHSIDQVFSGNLPWFVPAPSETDTLMVVMGAILVLFVLVVGILYFRLHALPERFLNLFDLVCLSFSDTSSTANSVARVQYHAIAFR